MLSELAKTGRPKSGVQGLDSFFILLSFLPHPKTKLSAPQPFREGILAPPDSPHTPLPKCQCLFALRTSRPPFPN